MLEQELKNIWKNASKTAAIDIETDKLIEEFDVKITSIQKKIRKRDTREITASVIGIIFFSYLAYEIPFPITKFSCFLSIGWFVYVIYKFKKSKKQNTTEKLSVPLTKQLACKKILIKQQIKLLNSAAYWYAGFSFITNFIFILGLENPADYIWKNQLAENLLPITTSTKITTLIGLAFFYIFIAWINKRVVKKELQPILRNIETIQQQLQNSN